MSYPLPLTDEQAVTQALMLRTSNPGLSYPVLAFVCGTYHGVWQAPTWWRLRLRAAGAVARPHGVPFGGGS